MNKQLNNWSVLKCGAGPISTFLVYCCHCEAPAAESTKECSNTNYRRSHHYIVEGALLDGRESDFFATLERIR